jgi:hypothetical protein
MIQVFHLFWTYIVSVSSKCCKYVAHVAMCVRSGGGARNAGVGGAWSAGASGKRVLHISFSYWIKRLFLKLLDEV